MFLTFGLNQICTYWAVTGLDGYNEPSFASPVQLDCRWEDRVERIVGPQGEEITSAARIFLGSDIVEGGYLALGTVAGADPRRVASAKLIRVFRKTPGLYAEMFERKAYL